MNRRTLLMLPAVLLGPKPEPTFLVQAHTRHPKSPYIEWVGPINQTPRIFPMAAYVRPGVYIRREV